MTQVLSDVKSVGGVVGCFLYDQKGGVLASDAPTLFKPAKLAEVGRALSKTLKAGAMALPDGTDVSLYYEEILIVAREIRKGTLLVVLCDPAMNANLLSMSINLAMEELCELAERSVSQAAQPPATAIPSPAPMPSPASPPATGRASGATKLNEETARAIEAALAKLVGPMASIIFRDCVETWEANGGGNLSALLADLRREIGDEEKGARFSALAAQMIANVEGGNG